MVQFRYLCIALLIYLGMAAIYLWVVPPLEGFDSIAHQNYVNYLRHTGKLPDIDAETAAYSYQLVQQPPFYYLLSAALTLPFPYHDWHVYVSNQENAYFGVLSARWSVDLPNPPPGLRASVRVGQLVSLLGGVLAVVGTWLWVRAVLGGRWARRSEQDQTSSVVPSGAPPDTSTDTASGVANDSSLLTLTLVAVMLFAINPLFLFISVTVSNDSWAVAGAVWVMWLTTELARRAHAPAVSPWMWIALGLAAGVAALVKYSLLLLILPVAAVLLLTYRRAHARALRGAAAAVLSACAISGFWYGRNLWLYGELVPTGQVMEAIPDIRRDEVMGWAEVGENLAWLFNSYWGVFVSIFAPAEYYRFWMIFVLVGGVGLLWTMWQTRRIAWPYVYGVSLVWLLSVCAAFLVWMRTVSYGDQARLLLIGSPPLALLLSIGWRAWMPPRWRAPLLSGLVLVLMAVALWPVPTLVANYRTPAQIDREQFVAESPTYQPVAASFEPGMELVGFDLPQGRALHPQRSLPLILYWSTAAPIEGDYTLFAHIAETDDRMWYQFDDAPAAGRHSTRQWQPGQVFSTTMELLPDPEIVSEMGRPPTCNGHLDSGQPDNGHNEAGDQFQAQLSVGFYPHADPLSRIPVALEDGNSVDRLTLARMRLAPNLPESVDEDAARAVDSSTNEASVAGWENGIRLRSVGIEWEPGEQDTDTQMTLALQTEWETTKLLASNLTVFVHLVDASGKLAAQADVQPCGGYLPTTTWMVGEPIRDRYLLDLSPALEPGELRREDAGGYELHLGWYDVRTGERLLLTGVEAADVEDRGGIENAAGGMDFLRLAVEPPQESRQE